MHCKLLFMSWIMLACGSARATQSCTNVRLDSYGDLQISNSVDYALGRGASNSVANYVDFSEEFRKLDNQVAKATIYSSAGAQSTECDFRNVIPFGSVVACRAAARVGGVRWAFTFFRSSLIDNLKDAGLRADSLAREADARKFICSPEGANKR
jgi:hypothetical protein